MGTWGTGIFDSDVAAEVRDHWREAILDGLDPAAATQRVRSELSTYLDDRDEGPIAWLALALAQHESGRLQDAVRDRALAVIAAGADLEQWLDEDPAAAWRRQKALERLRAKLTGPQPKERRLRRTKPIVGTWFDTGDVVHLRGEDGAEALVIVVVEGNEPTVVPLLWSGGKLPSRPKLERLPGLLWEARARWQAPERIGPIFRAIYEVWTIFKDDVFTADVGTIVAHGVDRPDLTPAVRASDHPSWTGLVRALGPDGWFRRLIEDGPRVQALVDSGVAVAHEFDPSRPMPESTLT